MWLPHQAGGRRRVVTDYVPVNDESTDENKDKGTARIDHLAVYPAVLIQEGINADSAGVLITTNPFD